ncbi:MAG: hypothetical protein QXQ37_06260 [Nitrososphaerota archaeon]
MTTGQESTGKLKNIMTKFFGPDYAKTLKTGLLEGFALAPGLVIGEMAVKKLFDSVKALTISSKKRSKKKVKKLASYVKTSNVKPVKTNITIKPKIKNTLTGKLSEAMSTVGRIFPIALRYGLMIPTVILPTYLLFKSIPASKRLHELSALGTNVP